MRPLSRAAALLLLLAPAARALDCAAVKPDARDFALAELPCLKSGPAAADAASMMQALASVSWPTALTQRLADAGLRVRFSAPSARAAVEQSGVYAWEEKTVYLWDRPRAAVVVHEFGHALDDLLQPDRLAGSPCDVLRSKTDPEFLEVWKEYARRVNAFMDFPVDEGGGRFLPINQGSYQLFMSRYQGSASGWFTETPLFDDPKNPVTGPRGYVLIAEYWAEGVQRYFTARAWLKAKDPKAYAYLERALQEAERGPLETVRLPADSSRCENAR